MRKSKVKNVKNNKLKETKNKLAETPEDPVRDFPRGSSATFDLDPGPDKPPEVDNTGGTAELVYIDVSAGVSRTSSYALRLATTG